MIGRQIILKGFKRVVHNQNALVFRQVFAVGDDEACLARFGHLQREVVGIKVLTFQGKKDGILLNLAAVGRNLVGFLVMLVYRFNRVHGFNLNEKKPPERVKRLHNENKNFTISLLRKGTAHLVHRAAEADGGGGLVLVEVAACARTQVVRTVSP